MGRTSRSTSITGRDGYIVNQALIYAIAHIQSLPEEKQEFSNMCDMCAIVLSKFSAFTASQIAGVAAHTGHEVNLWPLDDERYSAAQLAEKANWEPHIKSALKMNRVFAVSYGAETTDDPEILAMVAHLKGGGAVGSTGELFEREVA